jgi:hypothetical protein
MGTTMLDFKDFMVVEYMPGYDSLINYQAHKRKRGLIGENSWNQLGQKKPVGNYLPAPKKGTVEKHGKTFQRGDHVIPHTGPHAGERHIVSDSKKGHVTMVHANGGHKYDTMTVRAKHHHLSPAEKKESLDEDMSIQARKAAGRRMKRLSKKISRLRKRKLARVADKETINRRSQRQARDELFRKFSGGKSRSELPVAQRKAIEKKVARMSSLVKNRGVRKRAGTRKMDRARKAS